MKNFIMDDFQNPFTVSISSLNLIFVGKAPCMSTLRCGPLMSWTDESAIKWRQEKSDKCHWLQLHLMRTLIFSGLRDPFHVINSLQLQTAEIILTDQIYYYSLLPREWKNSLYFCPGGRAELKVCTIYISNSYSFIRWVHQSSLHPIQQKFRLTLLFILFWVELIFIDKTSVVIE